jgi:PKHD-type hydroxylase
MFPAAREDSACFHPGLHIMLAGSALLRSAGPPRFWHVIPDAFSPDECSCIRALADREDGSEGGLVTGQFDPKVRKSSLVWLPDNDGTAWVSARMARLAADANRDTFGFALDGFDERLQVAAYGPGHYYDWHIDRGRGNAAGRRKLTLSVQLSDPDDYAGGDLEVNADGRPFPAPRELGTAIVFAATTLHRVAPVDCGLRRSLVAWAHGPAFV